MQISVFTRCCYLMLHARRADTGPVDLLDQELHDFRRHVLNVELLDDLVSLGPFSWRFVGEQSREIGAARRKDVPLHFKLLVSAANNGITEKASLAKLIQDFVDTGVLLGHFFHVQRGMAQTVWSGLFYFHDFQPSTGNAFKRSCFSAEFWRSHISEELRSCTNSTVRKFLSVLFWVEHGRKCIVTCLSACDV